MRQFFWVPTTYDNSAANIFCQKNENLYNWMDNLWHKVENIVAKGEIARFEQFLLLSLCFQKVEEIRLSSYFYSSNMVINYLKSWLYLNWFNKDNQTGLDGFKSVYFRNTLTDTHIRSCYPRFLLKEKLLVSTVSTNYTGTCVKRPHMETQQNVFLFTCCGL